MYGIRPAQVEASDFRGRKRWIKSQIGEVQHRVEGDLHLGLCHVHSHAHVRAETEAQQRSHRALEPQSVGVIVHFWVAVGGVLSTAAPNPSPTRPQTAQTVAY
jgi:hypothetical protein